RNQFDKLDQLILAIHLALRQLLPTAVTPAFVPMRPNAPLDPMVEFVEKRSDVSTLVIVTPSPQNRVQLIDQIFGFQGHATPGKLISFASHLLIKRRQKNIAEQRRNHRTLRSPALTGKEPPFAIASCLEHCPNQAQYPTIRYSLGYQR